MAERIHIAGFPVRVGTQLRQRCAWCGEILIDMDLERIAVAPGCDPTPRTWEINTLVAVDGPASFTVAYAEGEELPRTSCARETPTLKAVPSEAVPPGAAMLVSDSQVALVKDGKVSVVDRCKWCGRTYGEHADERGPTAPVPRVPCLLLKSGFVPKRING